MRRLSMMVAVFLLAACGSVGLPDLGGVLGSPSSDRPSDIRGVVDRVDTRSQRIDLDVTYINNLRDDTRDQSVYYDSRTIVEYRGRTDYRPDQLERGDEVAIRGYNDSGRYYAERITVVRSVS
ncbi:MAG TPA: DUF5666 domain-containing protein [Thermoanaerobaculia bacterium]|nr:DUF5666 domain-containing protein [Thermoanaerobaculia bacterium]